VEERWRDGEAIVYDGFLGAHRHIVDAKGRVVMPAKYRARLERGVVVTPSPDPCLHVYPVDHFEREVAELVNGPRSNPATRARARALLGAASDEALDGQGRIKLPAGLRTRAGLEREVVVVGVGSYLEVWDAVAWPGEEARADAALKEHHAIVGEEAH